MKKLSSLTALFSLSALLFSQSLQAESLAIQKDQWSITPKLGVAPSTFNRKGLLQAEALYKNDIQTPTGVVSQRGYSKDRKSYSFSDFHKLPFTVGFDVGYGVMDNLEVFFNFDYTRLGGKSIHMKKMSFYNESITPTFVASSLNQYGTYIGGRYYFNTDTEFSPFIGGKLGAKFGNHSGSFSGGSQIGVDYAVADNVSLNLMSEVTTYRVSHHADMNTKSKGHITLRSQVLRSPKNVWSFPITAGVKFKI